MDIDKDIVISAPGKLIVHGEHAVVYGKRSLAGSLNIRTFLRLSTNRCNNKIALNLPDVDIAVDWPVEEIEALRTKVKKGRFASLQHLYSIHGSCEMYKTF